MSESSTSEPRTSDRPRIGWIGLGLMGGPMCGHVLDAGFDVTVWARRPESSAPLAAKGATVAGGIAELAARSDIVCTIVSMPSDVEQVVLGADGVLANLPAGGVVVDLTTSEPSLAVRIAEAAAAVGKASVDAPVSGGDTGAKAGTLSVMVGGEDDAVTRVRPVLDTFAGTLVHQGGPGAGQHTKMANQILVAGSMIATCEALVYAAAAGLDPERVLQTVTKGAGSSSALINLGPKAIAGDYAPGFFVEHFIKDLGIVLAESRRMGIVLPGATLADQLYRSLAQHEVGGISGGRLGTQALITVLAGLAGREWPPA